MEVVQEGTNQTDVVCGEFRGEWALPSVWEAGNWGETEAHRNIDWGRRESKRQFGV